MPSATTTSRWNWLHGSRSSRAGTSVCVPRMGWSGAIGWANNTSTALKVPSARPTATLACRGGGSAANLVCYCANMSDSTMSAGTAPAATPAVSPASTASANNTTFAVILSLSFCHLLNDMMQSLVPALYPILKDSYGAELRPGRPDHARLPVHRLDAAAAGRPLHRQKPQPYSLTVGMGFTLVGLLLMSRADVVSHDPARRRADRHGLVGVPSRGLARGAHGGGRTLWSRPVAVPGRRQHRLGRRAVARRLHRRAARPAQHRVVLAPRRWSPSFVLFQVGGWYARDAGPSRRPARAARLRRPPAAPAAVARPRRRAPWPSWWRCSSPRTSTAPASARTSRFYLIDKFGI